MVKVQVVLKKIVIALILILALIVFKNSVYSPLKLYWFIPDGVRAEPNLFNIYEWANEGKLPNIKKLMEKGSYGYVKPTYPGHTPTNFATLLTGSYPETHGVDDGPMREIGKPLDKVAVPGFRSVARKVEPIWVILEKQGEKVALLSIPGSTPPELNKGVVIRGRWGGWGADFAPLNFETKGNLSQRTKQGTEARFFYFGPQLTIYEDAKPAGGWENAPNSYSDTLEVPLVGWGAKIWALILDSTDDGKVNYDKVAFSLDKKTVFSTLSPGQWSNWQPIVLKWKTDTAETDVSTSVKIALIKVGPNNFYRIRAFYNNLNELVTQPAEAAKILLDKVGPMVDFADNFPPQLVYYPEDKNILWEESNLSFEWHKKAIAPLVESFKPSVVIHDIYTPNQILTSRWWMGYVDPEGSLYDTVSKEERAKLWEEVKDMYKKLDDMVGEILKVSGPKTYIVFTSDHGNVPLNQSVQLNNLFAQKGWLKFKIDPQTGEPIIDWKNSKVIFLKMTHVFVNPNGLAGNYQRASGAEYEGLRNEVIATISSLRDSDGKSPVAQIVKWENAREELRLDPARIGDLVIANKPGYGWSEKMTQGLEVFSIPLETGYKQAIKSDEVPGMWAPFIISGPNIKKGNFLGNLPFDMVDECPTIMKALGKEIPVFVQGKILPVFK